MPGGAGGVFKEGKTYLDLLIGKSPSPEGNQNARQDGKNLNIHRHICAACIQETAGGGHGHCGGTLNSYRVFIYLLEGKGCINVAITDYACIYE